MQTYRFHSERMFKGHKIETFKKNKYNVLFVVDGDNTRAFFDKYDAERAINGSLRPSTVTIDMTRI